MPALAQAQGDDRAELKRPCRRFGLAAGTEGGERLVERRGRIARPPRLEGSVRPADEEIGPLRILGGRQPERPDEPRFGLGGIEAERTLAGEREEAPRRQCELLRLSRVPRRLGELERLQVVVGEDLSQVLDPLSPLRSIQAAAER